MLKLEAIDTKLQSLSVNQQSSSEELNDLDIFKFDVRYSLFLKILASFIFLILAFLLTFVLQHALWLHQPHLNLLPFMFGKGSDKVGISMDTLA